MGSKISTSTTAAPAAKKLPAEAVTAASAQPKQADTKPSADTQPVAKAAAKRSAPAIVTLKHLVAALTDRHDLPKKQADTLLAEVFKAIARHLKSGDRVRIASLGIREVKDRPARAGRNPATGEAIQIAASRKISFRVSKELKDAI